MAWESRDLSRSSKYMKPKRSQIKTVTGIITGNRQFQQIFRQDGLKDNLQPLGWRMGPLCGLTPQGGPLQKKKKQKASPLLPMTLLSITFA